jgi:hypothetical protein
LRSDYLGNTSSICYLFGAKTMSAANLPDTQNNADTRQIVIDKHSVLL